MLFTLPREMVFKFLQEWLSPSDLRLLDSALSEKALRKSFHEMLTEPQFVLTRAAHGVVRDHACLGFIFRRGVRVEAVSFEPLSTKEYAADGYFKATERVQALFQQHLEVCGGSLKYLEAKFLPSSVLQTMKRMRPALEEFKTAYRLEDNDAQEGQDDIVRALPRLRRLTLIGTDYKLHSAASVKLMFEGEHALTHLNIECVIDDR
jgi:hypothetical protein